MRRRRRRHPVVEGRRRRLRRLRRLRRRRAVEGLLRRRPPLRPVAWADGGDRLSSLRPLLLLRPSVPLWLLLLVLVPWTWLFWCACR